MTEPLAPVTTTPAETPSLSPELATTPPPVAEAAADGTAADSAAGAPPDIEAPAAPADVPAPADVLVPPDAPADPPAPAPEPAYKVGDIVAYQSHWPDESTQYGQVVSVRPEDGAVTVAWAVDLSGPIPPDNPDLTAL